MDGTGTKESPATGSNMAGYTVSKLADGNCWMTSNLKLGLSTSQAIEVVTNSTGIAKSTKWTPTGSGGNNTAEPMNNNTVCTGSGDSRKCWYTWYAATAGSGTSSQTNTDASDSICPVGWRLPSNYTQSITKSYSALTNAYFGFTDNQSQNKVIALEANPMLFTRAGSYVGGSQNNTSNGLYWSATAYSSSGFAHNFNYIYNSATYPQNYNNKSNGFSVRCLAV